MAIRADDVTARRCGRRSPTCKREARASGEICTALHARGEQGQARRGAAAPARRDRQDAASEHALGTLRHELIPATLGRVPGVEAAVTGETAGNSDFNAQMSARIPLVIGFVLLLAFVLLLVSFRSIVVPLKAIVLNLLSVAPATGCSSRSSSGAGASTCSASRRTGSSRRGCRCSSS